MRAPMAHCEQQGPNGSPLRAAARATRRRTKRRTAELPPPRALLGRDATAGRPPVAADDVAAPPAPPPPLDELARQERQQPRSCTAGVETVTCPGARRAVTTLVRSGRPPAGPSPHRRAGPSRRWAEGGSERPTWPRPRLPPRQDQPGRAPLRVGATGPEPSSPGHGQRPPGGSRGPPRCSPTPAQTEPAAPRPCDGSAPLNWAADPDAPPSGPHSPGDRPAGSSRTPAVTRSAGEAVRTPHCSPSDG